MIGSITGGAEISAMTGDIRNTGAVQGPSTIGGVFGSCNSTTVTAAGDIVNAGEVASSLSRNEIGGIVGKLNDSQLIAVGGEIRNESNVTGASAVGGIAGMCDRNQTDSPIRAYGDIVNQGKISTTQADNIGGIVGSYNCKEGIVSDTGVIKNEGAIEGIGTYVGGIVGSYNIKASTGAVKKCINTGDVTASKGIQVGGLFGYVSITSSTEEYRNIENSYSTGQVNVTDATDATDSRNGTLVGCFSGNKIKNCYDTVTDALPMLGTTKYCQGVENCYSMSEDTSVTEPEGVVVKTKAEFASGEVAYLLDGTGENRAEAPVWGQNIGTDESPVLGGAAVYKDGDVYANTEHTYDVTYTWSADKKNCTAKQNCRLCGIEGAKETVAAAYSIKKQATEQAEGIGLYTAVFKNGLFTTQTAEVKIAKLTPKPTKPSDPSKPTNPSNPTKPTKPSDPSKPTNPSNPTKPTKPSDPSKPTNPSNPTKPTKPSDPSKPTNPSNPTNPTKPSDPSKPTNPSNPTKPTKPSDSSKPTNPSNPTKPTKPSNPSKPTNPSNPTKPTNNKKKPAAKGTTLKDSKGATYKVTGAKVKNPTVTYVKPKKNVKKVSIPATIKVPKKKLNAYKKLLKNAGISKSVKVVKM